MKIPTKSVLIVSLIIALSACGSGNDSVEGVDEGATQDVVQSDPGEFPDCSGTYSFVEEEGNACNYLMDKTRLIMITQHDDTLEYEHVLTGERMSERVRFFSGDDISIINFSGGIAIAHESGDDV
jgi:hypothetical protein